MTISSSFWMFWRPQLWAIRLIPSVAPRTGSLLALIEPATTTDAGRASRPSAALGAGAISPAGTNYLLNGLSNLISGNFRIEIGGRVILGALVGSGLCRQGDWLLLEDPVNCKYF